ncbi:hypothetical protein [Rummeliibacillus sp. TYF-LIM-RU47]|uniref:hypothetical protein n=1 Tax=Rummeliibacillus sp. TYF-LIM-RU47 TaxID=2608406 RepID=UPI00123915FD|nr:hypothetical protein [Rummeliibacillus sp. TYF-LIM-RU47]
MRYKHQCECMDTNCRTIILGPESSVDGIRCPRCGGPVFTKPFKPVSNRAWFVRSKIKELQVGHCFDLTPEQVETVLSLGDEYLKESEELHAELNY